MTKYEESLKVLVSDLGFDSVDDYYDTYQMYGEIVFERLTNPVVGNTVHRVTLMKRGSEWSIISGAYDLVFDKGFNPEPLTREEIKAFLDFIEEFEKAF